MRSWPSLWGWCGCSECRCPLLCTLRWLCWADQSGQMDRIECGGLFVHALQLMLSSPPTRRVNDSLATGPNDRAASMWFSMAVMSFTPACEWFVLFLAGSHKHDHRGTFAPCCVHPAPSSKAAVWPLVSSCCCRHCGGRVGQGSPAAAAREPDGDVSSRVVGHRKGTQLSCCGNAQHCMLAQPKLQGVVAGSAGAAKLAVPGYKTCSKHPPPACAAPLCRYDVTAWFAARTLTLLPFEIAQCVAFCVVA